MTPRERLRAAMAGRAVDRVPRTPLFMSWAAHAVGHTYRDFYLKADVLVRAQLEVTRRFGLDQVSAISDPWREAEGFGLQLDYPPEGVGIPRRYLAPEELAALHPFDPTAFPRTRDRLEAVGALAAAVRDTHSVSGWVEGPIAEYVDLRGLQDACMDLVDAPELFHQAAGPILEVAIAFARAQLAAGADFIGIGDAAASVLGPELYAAHVLPHERRLIAAIHEAGGRVKLHICGNITALLPHIRGLGADVLDLDTPVSIAHARAVLGPGQCLAGNFCPTSVLLRGTPQTVRAAAEACIGEGTVAGSRFVLQPGCEVPPGTPEANIRAFCTDTTSPA